MILESLLAAAVVLGSGTPGDDATADPDPHTLLETLQLLRDRLQHGAVLTLEELSCGQLPRHRVLAGVDVRAAERFGVDGPRMRDRLLPAFTAELRLLEEHRSLQRLGPLPDPSPVLSLVLDFEQELHRSALRRLKSLGLPSPFEVGPLARVGGSTDEPPAPAGEDAEAPVDSATPAAGNPPGDPLLLAEMLYAAGRYSSALDEYRRATVPEGERALEVRYRIADCLLQTGQDAAAIQAFGALVEAAPGTQWAAQAEWSVAFAEAMAALKTSRRRSGSR